VLSFFFPYSATTVFYTLSLHDALPILHQPYRQDLIPGFRELMERKEALHVIGFVISGAGPTVLGLIDQDDDQEKLIQVMGELLRSEEHTSELQSRENLVCRLLLEKKKE